MNKQKILFIEDNKSLYRNIERHFLRHGFEVIESTDKTDVFRSFQNNSPDIVIIWPSRDGTWDGLEVAQQTVDCNIFVIDVTQMLQKMLQL